MTLVLALDTSSLVYAVAVGSTQRPAAQRSGRQKDPGFAGLGDLAAQALSAAGAAFSDLTAIGVDVGPGGLSSIRAAVAYANGLAFSLGVKVFPAGSLELMAIAARRAGQDAAAVLSLKRGQAGNVYAGLYVNGENTALRHGQPGEVIPAVAAGLDRVCLAGMLSRDEVAPLLPGTVIAESGITDADVTVLYTETLSAAADRPQQLMRAVSPLNEASQAFCDSAAH